MDVKNHWSYQVILSLALCWCALLSLSLCNGLTISICSNQKRGDNWQYWEYFHHDGWYRFWESLLTYTNKVRYVINTFTVVVCFLFCSSSSILLLLVLQAAAAAFISDASSLSFVLHFSSHFFIRGWTWNCKARIHRT